MSAGPSVWGVPLNLSLFKFPPDAHPASLPPAPTGPVQIPDWLWTAALDAKVPITIAAVYAVSAKALNAYNKSNGKKPWAISQTKAFNAFVIAHNVFLAVYSAWTFIGMYHALKNTIVPPSGPDGWAGTIDSFCKIHGPAGLGNAFTYNQPLGKWESASESSILTADGLPGRDITGRMWNEGLAFYGWIFYLSKFYEVLDTFIILAKGKLSSTLQTYHHAGAMMAMWGGIRYMGSPIWLFCFFNSFIHSLMYTYYTVTAFNIRVPQFIKRTLTSMQISQFILGASLATVHSFINYSIPVQVKTETGSETQYQAVECISTTGATFAVWLNVVYLMPLTYLFVSFFIASYLKRTQANSIQKAGARRMSNVNVAEKAGWDAVKGINREVYGDVKSKGIANGNLNGKVNGKH